MKTLTDALTDLAVAFNGRNISPDQIALYLEDLEDLPADRVIDAIQRLRRTSRFFPTIAEIREGAVAGQPLDGLAELAWREVEEQALTIGHNPMRIWANGQWQEPAKPRWSNPITAEAVASIGWRNICLNDDPEQRTFMRNQFIKTWQAFSSRTLKRAQNGEAIDMGRSDRGEPRPIGDVLTAMKARSG